MEGTPPCSPAPTPPPCIPKHSQSFEVINEDEVIRSSEEIKSRLKEEIDVEVRVALMVSKGRTDCRALQYQVNVLYLSKSNSIVKIQRLCKIKIQHEVKFLCVGKKVSVGPTSSCLNDKVLDALQFISEMITPAMHCLE